MNLDQFEQWATGQSLLWAPSPAREYLRGQCVQSVCYYFDKVWHMPVIWADAYQWFSGGLFADRLDRIANDHNNPNQVPQAGDVIVWGPNTPGSGGAGHIAIVLSAAPGAATFISLDQNWGGKTVHRVTHNWSNVVGWIRIKGGKGGDAPAPQEVNVAIIQDADNWFGRFNKSMQEIRGRDASRAEMAPFIGQDFLHAIEAMEDDPEADAALNAQQVGQVAVRDNWQGQITTLQDVQAKNQTTINELNVTVTKAISDDTADKQALQEALKKVGELTAQLETNHDVLADQDPTASVPTDTTDINWFIKLLAKLLPGKK